MAIPGRSYRMHDAVMPLRSTRGGGVSADEPGRPWPSHQMTMTGERDARRGRDQGELVAHLPPGNYEFAEDQDGIDIYRVDEPIDTTRDARGRAFGRNDHIQALGRLQERHNQFWRRRA
jgi:hypothetical protein